MREINHLQENDVSKRNILKNKKKDVTKNIK